jgi:tRNA modification GTPase
VIDTAGLRESADPLELEGMRRTRQHLQQADVAVRVLDASAWADPEPPPSREIRVLNKLDLWKGDRLPAGVVGICCLDGRGLEELVSAIIEKADFKLLERLEEAVAINARHQHCLRTALDFLGDARLSLERGDAPEITALELRSALAAIAEIVGAVDTEEVLGKIFSTFCIGK